MITLDVGRIVHLVRMVPPRERCAPAIVLSVSEYLKPDAAEATVRALDNDDAFILTEGDALDFPIDLMAGEGLFFDHDISGRAPVLELHGLFAEPVTV